MGASSNPGSRPGRALRRGRRRKRPGPGPVRPSVIPLLCLLLLCLAPPHPASAQEAFVPDTIVLDIQDLFSQEEIEATWYKRFMAALHVTTKPWVVREELLFQAGEPVDSSQVSETERILRQLQIFRAVEIDTLTADGRKEVLVRTYDGWSLKPIVSFSVASDGSFQGRFGVNDINFLGLGHQLYGVYRKDVDRSGFNGTAQIRRVLGSPLDLRVNAALMSDGSNVNWFVGSPFRSSESRAEVVYEGAVADQDVRRYRVEAGVPDTLIFRKRLVSNVLTGGMGWESRLGGYSRLALQVGIRGEHYDTLPQMARMGDQGTLPDTLNWTVGLWGDFRRDKFIVLRRFNGFGTEDLDLSPRAEVFLHFAPAQWGWPANAIAPGVTLSAGRELGDRAFIWGSLESNALLTRNEVADSSRIVGNFMIGLKPGDRHSVSLQVQAGRLSNTAPGREFDLGFENAPRGWGPHSFVGTRTVWGVAEHRWFIWDSILDLFGLGTAAFFEYGGAWYEDQDPQWGGNVGVGLRIGSALAVLPRMSRIDLARLIGSDLPENKWVLSFGSSFIFPRRDIPTVIYRAQPPPP